MMKLFCDICKNEVKVYEKTDLTIGHHEYIMCCRCTNKLLNVLASKESYEI